MADLLLVEEVRDYLITQGVVKAPGTSGTLPVIAIDPVDGVPEPVPPADAVVGIRPGLQVPPARWYEEFLDERIVEFRVRALTSSRAELIQRQIRQQINGKKATSFGRLFVQHTMLHRSQPMPPSGGLYEYLLSFVIVARVTQYAV